MALAATILSDKKEMHSQQTTSTCKYVKYCTDFLLRSGSVKMTRVNKDYLIPVQYPEQMRPSQKGAVLQTKPL